MRTTYLNFFKGIFSFLQLATSRQFGSQTKTRIYFDSFPGGRCKLRKKKPTYPQRNLFCFLFFFGLISQLLTKLLQM